MEEVEYCDPFDGKKYGYWMKLEHAGRFVFAKDFISQNMPNTTVADISCATGYCTQFLSDACREIDGYDLRAEYLEKAQKRKIKNAKFYQIDFNKQVLTGKKYDVVVSFETIEHIENTNNFLQSLQNSVKSGGYLLLSVPNPQFEELDENGKIIYKFHKHIFEKEEISQSLKSFGFEVDEVLGQALCNMIVSNEHKLKHGGGGDKRNIIRNF